MFLPQISAMTISFNSPLLSDYAAVTYRTPLGYYSLHGYIRTPFCTVVSYDANPCRALLDPAMAI